MANLSDLLAPGANDAAVPEWIAALGSGSSFQEHGYGSVRSRADAAGPIDPAAALEAAVAEAYAKGAADERAANAEAQAHDLAAQQGLALAFARLDDTARSVLAQRLADCVASLCEQVIEPALVDRSALAARCTVLADKFSDTAGQCTLHLHPDDVRLLAAEAIQDWTIQPDAALPRGSLLLEHSDGAVADGPEEWRRLIAAALGA